MAISLHLLSPAELEKFLHIQATLYEQEVDQARVRDLRDYYYGRHPTQLTDRQEEFLGKILTESDFPFCHNIMRAVVDVLRERLSVTGIVTEGDQDKSEGTEDPLATQVWQWWQAANLPSEQTKLYRRILRDGKGYLVLGQHEENRPTAIVNSAFSGIGPNDGESGGITFQRHPDTDEPWLATKYWWSAEWDGAKVVSVLHKTVYLDNAIWKFKRDMKARYGSQWVPAPDEGEAWPLPWLMPDGEPIGLPVIEFVNPGGSEIEQLVQLQNLLNKSWLDIIAVADVQGFGLNYVRYDDLLGAGAPTSQKDDPEGKNALKMRPGNILEIDAAEVGKLPAEDMANLLSVPQSVIQAIAGSSRTPQYYLRAFGGADVPSGESLKQLENGLVARAQERQTMFGDELQRMFKIWRRMHNAFGSGKVDAEIELSPVWASCEIRNETYDAQVATQHKALGVPDRTLWVERLGYTPEQADEFEQAASQRRAQELQQTIAALSIAPPLNVTNA